MDVTITRVIHEYQLKFNDMPGTLEMVFGWAKEYLPGKVLSIEPSVWLRSDGSGFHRGWVVRCEASVESIPDQRGLQEHIDGPIVYYHGDTVQVQFPHMVTKEDALEWAQANISDQINDCTPVSQMIYGMCRIWEFKRPAESYIP